MLYDSLSLSGRQFLELRVMFAFFTVLRGKLGTLMTQNDWHFLSLCARTHTHVSLTQVAHYDDTRECSLQPQAAEVMRSVNASHDLNPLFGPLRCS